MAKQVIKAADEASNDLKDITYDCINMIAVDSEQSTLFLLLSTHSRVLQV